MKRRNASAKLFDAIDTKEINMLKTKIRYAQSIIDLTHILLSSLHVWSIDAGLDKLFADKLSLLKPKYPIAFGRISRGSHLFVMFPPRRAAFSFASGGGGGSLPPTVVTANKSSMMPGKEKSMNLINFDEPDADAGNNNNNNPMRKSSLESISASTSSQSISRGGAASSDYDTPSPSIDFWLAAKVITTEHLVTILAISNAFMNLQSFIDLQIKKEYNQNIFSI